MEIGARLHHLQLLCPDPETCAQFYARAYGMQLERTGPGWTCVAPDRRLSIAPGPANHLGFAAFAFAEPGALEAYRRRVASRIPVSSGPSTLLSDGAFAVADPDGNTMLFGAEASGDGHPSISTRAKESIAAARLQHVAVRTTDPARLAAFYSHALGFVVSDRVEDDDGRLRACFLRTDEEHHVLAIFDAAEIRHDHFSLETTDWTALRDWADHMSRLGIPLAWGVGRHGPGNDTFFMIRDPDGNLSEISTELEVCVPGRNEGLWRHEQRTLNVWGTAIMRS
jgi:catechol 2,3-dioxygenase